MREREERKKEVGEEAWWKERETQADGKGRRGREWQITGDHEHVRGTQRKHAFSG